MTQFCDACHGDTAPGASTNVVSGVFDSGPTGATGVLAGSPTASLAASATGFPGAASVSQTQYESDSTFGAPLNGGGFVRMPDPYQWQDNATLSYVAATSSHKMDVSGPIWGSGSAVSGESITLTCTDCHDPHGTSNYRLLKASVNGNTVGGYDSNDVPTPFVFSKETGYPIPTSVVPALAPNAIQSGSLPGGGWLKHEAGALQMAQYKPNYTKTSGTDILHTDNSASLATKSMSTWCAACHENYNQISAGSSTSYNYNPYLPAQGFSSSGPLLNTQSYHRHAVNVTMAGGFGMTRDLTEEVTSSPAWVPLEAPSAGSGSWDTGYLGCLTCHRAHGSSVDMTGWASAHLGTASVTVTSPVTVYAPIRDNVMGVDPGKTNTVGTSSLLRADNRGVCERCQNK